MRPVVLGKQRLEHALPLGRIERHAGKRGGDRIRQACGRPNGILRCGVTGSLLFIDASADQSPSASARPTAHPPSGRRGTLAAELHLARVSGSTGTESLRLRQRAVTGGAIHNAILQVHDDLHRFLGLATETDLLVSCRNRRPCAARARSDERYCIHPRRSRVGFPKFAASRQPVVRKSEGRKSGHISARRFPLCHAQVRGRVGRDTAVGRTSTRKNEVTHARRALGRPHQRDGALASFLQSGCTLKDAMPSDALGDEANREWIVARGHRDPGLACLKDGGAVVLPDTAVLIRGSLTNIGSYRSR